MKLKQASSVFIFICIIISCSGDWTQFRGNQGQGEAERVIYPPLGIKWKLKLQEESKTSKSFNNPVVIGDTVYFGSTDGNFYALDLGSGYMKWVFQTNAAINSVPIADQEAVYFGSNDGGLYAVDRKTGILLWRYDADCTIQSSVVRYGDFIVFSSDGGNTCFLDTSGRLVHSLPNPVWHYHTYQIYKDIMYFAPGPVERPRTFSAYDIYKKEYLWILNAENTVASWYSFPALKGDRVLYSKCSNYDTFWELSYLVRDRFTGEVIWEKNEEAVFGQNPGFNIYTLFIDSTEMLDFMAPVVYGKTVIYSSGDNVVRAFRIKDGSSAWTRTFDEPASSAPTLSGDRIYLGLRGGEYSPSLRDPRLICLSARDGRLLWEFETEGAILGAPVIAGKWMIFCTEDLIFYVLEAI